MKALGIVLGVNTIGWAVVEENHITAAGCRIIPMGADAISDFLKDKAPVNQRAEYRRNRHRRERQLMRRERLLKELKAKDFLPPHFAQQIDEYGHFLNDNEPKLAWDNGTFIFKEAYNEMLANAGGAIASHDQTIHYLRKKALTHAISKEELAWVILQFNKHRGRSSERDSHKEELQQILKKQQEFIPELTDDLIHKIIKEILYYQRPVTGKAPVNLRNPLVEQLLAELRHVVKDVIKRHGAIDEIRFDKGIHRENVEEAAISSLRGTEHSGVTKQSTSTVVIAYSTTCGLLRRLMAPRNDGGGNAFDEVWRDILKPRLERFKKLTGLKPKESDLPYIDYRYYTLRAVEIASEKRPDNVREVLENVIVTFKQDLRVISRKGNGWVIRRPLHKESVFGEVHLPWVPNTRRLKNPKYFAMRKPLNESFTQKTIESITDQGIQKILMRHLEACGNDPKIAFSPEGIETMNAHIRELNNGKPHQPIYSVRKYEKGEKFAVGQTGNKSKKFVEAAKGTNLFFAVFKQEKLIKKTGEIQRSRFCYTIPLNVMVECQKQYGTRLRDNIESYLKEKALVPNDLSLLFILSPNDLISLPSGDIFRVVSFTGNRLYAIPMTVARCIVDKKEFTQLNKTEFTDDGQSIKEVCMPLKVDRLGNMIQ